MGRPYSQDLRCAIVQAIEDGRAREEVAEAYKISLSSVGRFLRHWRATGNVRPEKFGGAMRWKDGRTRATDQTTECRAPDITLAELGALLAKQKILVDKSSIARSLDYLDLTSKLARGQTRSARRGRSP
jgi:transposase